MAEVALEAAQEIVLVHVIQVALEDVAWLVVAIVIIHAGVDAVRNVEANAKDHVKHTVGTVVQVVKESVLIYVNLNVTQLAKMIAVLDVKVIASWNAQQFVKMDVQRTVRLDVVDLA